MKTKMWFVGLLAILMVYVTAQGALAAVTGCIDAYTYNDTDVPTNVSAGNVCINETDYDVNPTVAVKCGTWYACVVGACSVQDYYVGFAGDGTATCVATDWVSTGIPGSVAENTVINVTENASSCTASSTPTPTYNACANAYTRQGPDGLCDGAGALDTNDATLHVTAGNVCAAGTNHAANSSLKCGQWSNCVAGATTAPQYYVGYAASGTACVDTGWVSAGSSVDYGTIRVRTTEHVDTCSVIGYAASYDKGDFQNIVVDGLGTAGAETVDWLDIVVLLVILGFLVGIAVNMKKLGK